MIVADLVVALCFIQGFIDYIPDNRVFSGTRIHRSKRIFKYFNFDILGFIHSLTHRSRRLCGIVLVLVVAIFAVMLPVVMF